MIEKEAELGRWAGVIESLRSNATLQRGTVGLCQNHVLQYEGDESDACGPYVWFKDLFRMDVAAGPFASCTTVNSP